MKNFSENIFRPYLFPIVLLLIGAYIKTGDNLQIVSIFFSNSSIGFVNFFNYQFYLWE